MILQTMYGELSLASLADPVSFGFDSDVDMPLDTPTLIGELMAGADGVLNTPVSRESKGNFNFTKPEVDLINRPVIAVRQSKSGKLTNMCNWIFLFFI